VSTEKSHSDKTSADDKSIGFDYQYYYFLDRILNLKSGQSAGLEVKDDVHSELDADYNILCQVKHTVQKNSKNEPIALTELDSDLWKTLFNWSQVICDKTQGRNNSTQQLRYLAITEFHLVSNKSRSIKNEFHNLIDSFHAGEIEVTALSEYLGVLTNKTSDTKIKGYIQAVKQLAPDVLKAFIQKIRFELGLDDIINRVKRSILEKIIDTEKVDLVFERLDSNIKSNNFIAIKNGESIVISFEQFMQRYRRIFDDGRTKKLVLLPFTPDLPEDIFAQKFIKCLLHIGDITLSDEEFAIEYTKYKLRITTYFRQWVQAGDLVPDEVEEFHNEVFLRWQNEFRVAFRSCTNLEQVIDSATNLLSTLRRENFKLSDNELNTSLSNGALYHLSDIGRIGWHRDWNND
tara:strand:- start:530911 stop:532122 length:1212 start_codon:yes stop_codon:yes gene_type:complete